MLGFEINKKSAVCAASSEVASNKWSIEQVTQQEYTDFLEKNPQYSTAFNRYEILALLGEVFNRRQLTLGFSDERGELNGVTSLLIQKKGPFSLVQGLPSRNAQYIAAETQDIPVMLAKLRTHLAFQGVGQQHFSFPPFIELDTDLVQAGGYIVKPNSAKIIAIEGKSRDEIMAQVQPRMRTAIRKTEKDGVTIVKASAYDMEVVLPDLLAQTYERQSSFSPYPSEMGRLLHEKFGEDPTLDMRSAQLNGETVAMMIAASDLAHKNIYSWMIARNYDESIPNLNFTARLVYEIAVSAAERGHASFDLGGGVSGIHAFKEKLGGVDKPYYDISGTHPLYVPVFQTWGAIKTLRSKLA